MIGIPFHLNQFTVFYKETDTATNRMTPWRRPGAGTDNLGSVFENLFFGCRILFKVKSHGALLSNK